MAMDLTRRQSLLGAAAAMGAGGDGGVPLTAFGGVRISRLIAGGNPVSGTSHWSAELSREMVDYFSAANTKRFLDGCARNGINTWLSRGDRHILRLLHEYRQEGGRIHWIAQTATEIDFERNLGEIARETPAGIYLHGVKTDRAWMAGAIDKVQDQLKAIRQTGARVGLGSHIPEVFDYVESKGWDVDFYMTCLYNLSRTPEVFHEADRAEMLTRVRATRRQCLIFKVYGATRRCASSQTMQEALSEVAQAAKPEDCVVIGMYPKYKDQAAENALLWKRAFSSAGQRS